MGHYRALLELIQRNDNMIPDIIISIAYISPVTATPLTRWKKASQIILEKDKG
jgi:hypothetical protein